MNDAIKERRRDKQELYREIVNAGGKPARNNAFHCFQHDDKTASSCLKRSKDGFYYFRCFVCNFWMDVWDLEARNRGLDVRTVIKEHLGEAAAQQEPKKYYYKSVQELIDSLDYIEIEEVNPYTNPDTGNIDLLVIRYLPRGGNRKQFSQSHQTPNGFVKKRPDGLLPLFNRKRVMESSSVVFVEGEKCVRYLTELGIVATTGAGGSSNASAHDYSILAGKTVILFPDHDQPGKRYMGEVAERLRELVPEPTVYTIETDDLELLEGEDVVDIIEKTKAEGGNPDDCKLQIELILAEAKESNELQSFEELLEDMRQGRRENLAINGFPILTNEAMTLLNQQVSVLYGNAGFGKTLFVGKLSDDLALMGYNIARLQLEDDLSKHLLRTLAQQSNRAELTNPNFHKQNPVESEAIYREFQGLLQTVTKTIVADELQEWDVRSILEWTERMLKAGKTLIVVDPVSVVMTDKVWIDSHRLMWGTKKLLRQYPYARVLFVTHPNAEGEVSGGQAYKRFCHNLLILTKFKQPKSCLVLTVTGKEEVIDVPASIGIVKSRDGRGSGLEIAVRLNPDNICIEELGVILKEFKENSAAPRPPRNYSGRDLEKENEVVAQVF